MSHSIDFERGLVIVDGQEYNPNSLSSEMQTRLKLFGLQRKLANARLQKDKENPVGIQWESLKKGEWNVRTGISTDELVKAVVRATGGEEAQVRAAIDAFQPAPDDTEEQAKAKAKRLRGIKSDPQVQLELRKLRGESQTNLSSLLELD